MAAAAGHAVELFIRKPLLFFHLGYIIRREINPASFANFNRAAVCKLIELVSEILVNFDF